MFAYCGNNPVNRYDPNGDSFLLATICGIEIWKIGVAFGGLILAYTVVKNTPLVPTVSPSKIETRSKDETDSKTKELTPTKPKPKAKDPEHHIVAQKDRRAEESRQILRDVGIEPVTDLRNLVILPKNYHVKIHTSAYHNYVTERLRPVAGDKAGVEKTLALLRLEILAFSAVGIRWE